MELKVIGRHDSTAAIQSIMERHHMKYGESILPGRIIRSVAMTESPDGIEGLSMDCQVLAECRCYSHPSI